MSNQSKRVRAFDVAMYFIHLSNLAKKPITNKKLQKLVYYAQVWSLAIGGDKLFNERLEAWVHGPAIPKLYPKFKHFGFSPIQIDTDEIVFSFSRAQKNLLDNIWRVYGKYNAEYLEALTHSELPWQEAREGLELAQASSNAINLETAKAFYAAKLK